MNWEERANTALDLLIGPAGRSHGANGSAARCGAGLTRPAITWFRNVCGEPSRVCADGRFPPDRRWGFRYGRERDQRPSGPVSGRLHRQSLRHPPVDHLLDRCRSFRPTSATQALGTRCATRSWPPGGSRTSGRT